MASRHRQNVKEELPYSENANGSYTDKEKEMSLEDRLEFIDREIRKLRVFCVNAGYSSAQIENFALPFLETRAKVGRKQWLLRAVKLSIFLVVASGLIYTDPAYRLICAAGRRGFIALLPLWDWTRLYQTNCAMDNPFFVEESLKEEDCQVCEGQFDITRLRNVDSNDFVELYLKQDKPVVVEDGIEDWLDPSKITVSYLSKMFTEHPGLKLFSGCKFSSNIKTKFGNHRPVLVQAAAGEISNYFLQWENCFLEAAKVVRQMYRRPYFLSRVVELSDTNTIYVSSNYSGKLNKPTQITQALVIVMQLKGEIEVIAFPRPPCDGVCATLTTRLKAGEVFVATDFMWDVQYYPTGSGENIGIGIGGTLD